MEINVPIRIGRVVEQLRSTHLDFLIVTQISIALVLAIFFQQQLPILSPIRLFLGIVYVLWIPGYCLTAALFPAVDDLTKVERVGLSLGLSVACIPVIALLLDHLPWGLQLWPILLAEYVSTLIFMVIALWRRSRLPVDRVYTVDFTWQPRRWWQTLPAFEKRVFLIVSAAVLTAVIAVLWTFLVPSSAETMTEFYMLGKVGLAEDYPRQAIEGQELSTSLGLRNLEHSAHTYWVEVWVEDTWNPGRRQQVAGYGPLTLAHSANQEWLITWRMPWAGQDQQVHFLLFTDGRPEPYRRLRLFMNVDPK